MTWQKRNLFLQHIAVFLLTIALYGGLLRYVDEGYAVVMAGSIVMMTFLIALQNFKDSAAIHRVLTASAAGTLMASISIVATTHHKTALGIAIFGLATLYICARKNAELQEAPGP
jgi:low affinity Fe/Cu permease